jgi:Zn-dependent M28 family amino/carboxypeptidase
MRRLLFLPLLLSLMVAATIAAEDASSSLPAAAQAAMKKIDPERIRAHVKFLSDDLLEGRGTGQRGGDIAAAYMAAQFELYGLKPAGDNGTYFQKVALIGMTLLPESTFSIVPQNGQAMPLKLLDQIVATDETQQPSEDIDAPIVFVGYGIEAPEYKWDDYKGADVRGKVLLMLVNEPPSDDPSFFKGKALTFYGRWVYKYEEAARKGAAGVILIHKTDMASYGWDVVRNSWSGENSSLKLEGPALKLASWVQLGVAQQMASMFGKNLDQMMQQANSREFRPVELPLRLKAHMVSKVRHFESSNVLAELPGSDPNLKEQAIVYSAHYDHLGIRPDMPGDNIYNGANDNASGCAILLELARAYASAAEPPKRSVLFAAVTAEEQGLRGSEYLGKHPPIPAKKIALDLNYDDIKPWGTPEEVEVPGAERTTFYPVVEATAREFDLNITPESNPGAGHYYRSDHFSLARVGVPSFSINEGLKFKGHTTEWGSQKDQEYTEKYYHHPSDEYHPDMDFTGDAIVARFGFALGWKAATQPELVQWKPGDEFEAARKHSEERSSGGR